MECGYTECGGCSCHVSAPCDHCTEHDSEPDYDRMAKDEELHEY